MWVLGDEVTNDGRKHRLQTCSECGFTKTTRVNMLNIMTRCKACGMMERNRATFGKHRGVGELSLTFFNYFRGVARRRDIQFDVTPAQLWDLFLAQDRKCALSGLPLSLPVGSTTVDGIVTHPDSPSLDRKDSGLGYTPENVQWVHKCVNVMKNSFPQDVFVAFCRAVADHSEPTDVKYLEQFAWKHRPPS